MVGEVSHRDRWRVKLILPVVALLIVAAAVLWALSVVGTPGTARNLKLDRARIRDLQRIHWAVDRYYKANGRLPAQLEELDLEKETVQDPDTGQVYGYVVSDAKNYELSATFTYEGTEDHPDWRGSEWKHRAGTQRFSFSVPEK